MQLIIGILAFIFVLGLIILVHEGGHFYFARKVNILCREFAFGMGPILLKKKKGETLYTLRAFPIGGFCAIAGEEYEGDPLTDKQEIKLEIENGVIKKIYLDIESELFRDIPTYKLINYEIYDENQTGKLFMTIDDGTGPKEVKVDPQALFVTEKQELQIAPYNRTIGSKTKRARAMVIFGGPLMNFLLAILVFFIAGLLSGFPNYESSVINDITKDTPAYDAGLRTGDKIVHLQSGLLEKDITNWHDLSDFMDDYIIQYPTNTIYVTFIRDHEERTAIVRPQVIIYSISLISDYTKDEVVIGKLDENSKAYKAGLREGQEIIAVNDKEVTSWKDVYDEFINNDEGKEVTFTIKGLENKLTVTPYSKEIMDTQKSLSGESIPMVNVAMIVSPTYKFDLGQSFIYSGKMTVSSFGMIIDTLRILFTSDEVGVENLSGPVGIFTLTTNIAQQGFVSILNWIGMLSVNIGLLNLLPIPALDGGRLVFLGYEAITKKKPSPKVETALIGITMMLLIGLMIYVTYNDILRLLGW